MMGFIDCYNGDPMTALKHMAISEEQSPFDPFLASIQLTRATAYLRIGDIDSAGYWAERSTMHRTAYSQMHYHAALVLQASGRRDAAQMIIAGLARRDPGYDVRRYFASLHVLPEDLAARLNRSQAQLLG